MPERQYISLESHGILSVDGADAGPFLQDLITNNIELVTEERVIYAALLTPQGKFLHDFIIAKSNAGYLFDCEADRVLELGQRLAAYRLRAKIDLADATEDYQIAALIGEGVFEALGLTAEPGTAVPGAAVPFKGGMVFCDPRDARLGARAILPIGEMDAALAGHGFTQGTLEDYERLRLSLGVPDGSRDMAVEKSTLLENDFERLHGVDFEKGCYVGQELTARTKYRGLVKKKLMPVDISGPLPPPGTPIKLGDKDAGEMRSGIDGRAMALLRLERIEQAGGEPFQAGDALVTPASTD